MASSEDAKAETLKRLFETFRSQDRDVAEALIADSFTFPSPYDDAIDKQAYFEHCWSNASRLQDQTLETVLVSGDTAFVTYQASTPEGISFRNTERFHFAGDQISAIEVFFGAAYHHGVFTRMR